LAQKKLRRFARFMPINRFLLQKGLPGALPGAKLQKVQKRGWYFF
jgi:hypothetical protein